VNPKGSILIAVGKTYGKNKKHLKPKGLILIAAGKNPYGKIKQRLNPKGFNISSRR